MIYLSFIHLTTIMSQTIIPLMPTQGDHGAPQFDPTKPHKLRCFFDNLNFLFVQSQVVDDKQMKQHALQFIDCDTADLGMVLGRGIYQNHISQPGRQPWKGNLRSTMHRLVFTESHDGVICNRSEQEVQEMTGRKIRYCHLPIHTLTIHHILLDGDI